MPKNTENPTAVKTRQACADHFKVSTRTVADWLKLDGFPGRVGSPGKRNGHYPLEEIAEWRRKRLGSGGNADRDRLLRYKADTARLDYLERVGELVAAEDVEHLIQRTIETTKSIQAAIPAEIMAVLPTELPEETKAELFRLVDSILKESYIALADMKNWREGIT